MLSKWSIKEQTESTFYREMRPASAGNDALGTWLRGTGLGFVRAGAETVAIRKEAPPAAITLARANTVLTSTEPDGKTPSADTRAPAAAQLPDVNVIAPRPPTEAEFSGDALYQFIVHHATTPYPSSQGAVGSLTRWRGGRPETICPRTLGLPQG